MKTYTSYNRNGEMVKMTVPTDTVSECDACPNCGENRMDWLAWQDEGEYVRCGICGTEYVPGPVYDYADKRTPEMVS